MTLPKLMGSRPLLVQKPSGMHHIRTKLFHYLNQNHIPCTTRVWKTTLQSEFKIIQTYSKPLDIAGDRLGSVVELVIKLII
jgi:hypothetical protein